MSSQFLSIQCDRGVSQEVLTSCAFNHWLVCENERLWENVGAVLKYTEFSFSSGK